MKKNLQIWFIIVLALFLFPVVIQFIPDDTKISTSKIIKENALIVYASNITEELSAAPEPEIEEETKLNSGKVLLYNTHSYEAYEPVIKSADGKVMVDHQTGNVVKMGDKLKSQLEFSGVEADILKKAVPAKFAYSDIRPYVKKQIAENKYDLIIDLHRDSVGPEKTTILHENQRYAKVAFVVGTDNANYKRNAAMTNRLKAEMEKRIPGITRNVIPKGGAGVDGKYNQDLHPNLILLELGGVGNTEDELNRTVSVISEAVVGILNELKAETEEK